MAPVATLYRLVWGGRLFDQESWSCSLHIGSTPGVNLAASTFSAALTAWMARASSNLSGSAKLDFIKFNQINPVTGRYSLPTSEELVQNDLAVGTVPAAFGQLSLAVSTRTALARGRGHAGRFYPPIGDVAIDTITGLTNGTVVADVGTSAATLLRDINTSLAGTGQLVVFSKVGQSVETITGVRVGRVMDTMRSRRRSLVEAGAVTPL